MQRFKNILAYVDPVLDEHPPLARGVRPARQNTANLTAMINTVSSEGVFHCTFFGSIDMSLLRKCPAPLWLMTPGELEAFRRILVSLYLNVDNEIKHKLGMTLLTLATSLNEMDGAPLMIVHA